MPTTPNMSMVLPVDHDDADVWGAILNTALTLNDLHDHTTGKGVPVPSAALKINADVAWSFAGTTYAITALKAVDFTPTAASSITSYSSVLFANSTDANNLYYRNASGTNVRITNGSTLDVTIVGGIGGDYSSVGALLDYDDASDTYRFRQETAAAVRQFAKVKHADLVLVEYDAAGDASVPANVVTIKSPDALAASYDVTMPAALPSGTDLVSMTSAGVLAADGKHGDRVIMISAYEIVAISTAVYNTDWRFRASGGMPVADSLASVTLRCPITLNVGDRIKSVSYTIGGDGAADVVVTIYKMDLTDTVTGAVSIGTATHNNHAAAQTTETIDVTDTTVTSSLVFFANFAANATGISIYGLAVTYDRP